MEIEILCIFLPTGKTFTFKDVIMLHNNETHLEFAYRAMSDTRMKQATFPKATLCGWSITPFRGGLGSIMPGQQEEKTREEILEARLPRRRS